MSYNTGSITSATQPAKDLMDTVGGYIDAHAAWEFVEEVAGTGTNVARVYKCLGTANSFGADFYVALVRTSLTGRVGIVAGETYDSGTKKFGNGATYGTAVVETGLNYGTARHVANETTMTSNTAGYLKAADGGAAASGVAVNTTGFSFYASVTADRVVLGTLVGSAGTAVYAGLFDSFHAVPGVEAFPLCVAPAAGGPASTSFTGATTRATGSATGSQTLPWYLTINNWTPMEPAYGQQAGISKERISNKFLASRIALYPGNGVSRSGAVMGRLKDDVRMVTMDETIEAVGDTLESGAWVVIEATAAGAVILKTTV